MQLALGHIPLCCGGTSCVSPTLVNNWVSTLAFIHDLKFHDIIQLKLLMLSWGLNSKNDLLFSNGTFSALQEHSSRRNTFIPVIWLENMSRRMHQNQAESCRPDSIISASYSAEMYSLPCKKLTGTFQAF